MFPRFPVALLRSLFGDLYAVEWIFLEAADFGALAKRKRLYCVLALRRVLRLKRPLSDLAVHVATQFVERCGWRLLFCLGGADDGFSKAVAARADEYMKVFGDVDSVYDLDQLP